MNLPFLIAGILFFGYSIRYLYFWIFQAQNYVMLTRKRRREYREKLFFMPQIILFDFYDQSPQFEIWLNRVVGLIFLAASIIAIIVGFRGPF